MAYGKKRRGGHKNYQSRKPAAEKAPVREPEKKSEAMELLRQQTSEMDSRPEHERAFAPKPRAIRKYERFANMGE